MELKKFLFYSTKYIDNIELIIYLRQIVYKRVLLIATTQALAGSKRMVRPHPLHLFSSHIYVL
jgi:hypothetical protein